MAANDNDVVKRYESFMFQKGFKCAESLNFLADYITRDNWFIGDLDCVICITTLPTIDFSKTSMTNTITER